VYALLEQNELCQYYDLNSHPAGGQAMGLDGALKEQSHKFAFLDNKKIAQQLYVFSSDSECHIEFYLPQVHCSSCVYLLENLHKLLPGVAMSALNFSKKTLKVSFSPAETSPRNIAQFLTGIRLLSDLKHEGVVALEGKKIEILNLGKLVKIANIED